MAAVFVSLSDGRIATLIDEALYRVAIAAPGVRSKTAEALQRAVARLGQENVAIVLDCNEDVFRLGYGELGALVRLRESGCRVRQCAGLRVGVLVSDERAWTFAPTALYVEGEVHSDETPNAVTLSGAAVDRVIRGLMEPNGGSVAADTSQEGAMIPESGPEIGVNEVSDEEIGRTTDSLDQAPPIPFDIARQVRVFEPYIQYVDISLRGCAIQRYRLEVPKSIQGLDRNDEVAARMRMTFELIERNSGLSSKPLEHALNDIRDHFTRSLGRPWGRVMLRSARRKFDERIAVFRQRLEEHREYVEKSLGEQLDASRQQLVDYFLPIAKERPPDAMLGQVTGVPTEEQIRNWLDDQLLRVFPCPSDLVSEMILEVQYRDVTYETLNEDGFGAKLRAAFPYVDWDKPFKEFDAAKAREDITTNEGPSAS